jgi:hypothetical protein
MRVTPSLGLELWHHQIIDVTDGCSQQERAELGVSQLLGISSSVDCAVA